MRTVVVEVRVSWPVDELGPDESFQQLRRREEVAQDLERTELLDTWVDSGAVVSLGIRGEDIAVEVVG